MKQQDLISDYMVEQNEALHLRPEGYGGDGWKHTDNVFNFAKKLNANSVLDYGCGEGALKKGLIKKGLRIPITEYDPAILFKSSLPNPSDLVVCTDVLEHVEPDKLDNVIGHLYELTRNGCYIVVATRPANKILPDGRNAHLIIEAVEWWRYRIISQFQWRINKELERRKGNGSPHDYTLWLLK